MALTQVTGPYPIFTDLDGSPLDDGYLYIGAANQDPETNPIQVFWDSNFTIPATQPIRTNNGYAWRNGTPGLLYAGSEFSITIRNKRNEFVLYSPLGYGFDPKAVSASVVKNDFIGNGVQTNFTLSASPSTKLATNIFINGVYQEKDSYTLTGNVISFSIAPPLSSSIEVLTNETGVINAGNATDISYTLNAPGATLQSVQTKLQQYVSVKDFGAVGDGVADDTAAINAAIAATSNGATLVFPSGNYRYTTVLTIPSNITIQGSGRNFGCTFSPDGCAAFKFDGSLYGGGWVFRVRIQDILIDGTNMTGPEGISIKQAYNIDFNNVFLFNVQTGVTSAVYVSGSNDLVFQDFILYGTGAPNHYGFNIDGTTSGPVSIKLISPDIETCNRGIRATGTVVMDIFSPYMERNIVCYTHEISAGQVNIYGGIMSSINGYGINVDGPNLLVSGVDIDPYIGASPGGLGINATAVTAFNNVYFSNVPKLTQSGFVDGTANYLTLNLDRPPVAGHWQRSFFNTKVLQDAVPDDLFQLRNFAEYCKCKLTLHGYLGLAYVIKEYQFIIVSPGSTTSSVATTTVLDTSGGNWIANMSMTLTPDPGNGYTTISATVDTDGALGAGQPFTIYAQLEISATETGVAGVYLM